MNRLRELRESRGLSLRQLGAMVGMNHSTIGKIETGKVRLAEHHLDRFARALECEPEELLVESGLSDQEKRLVSLTRRMGERRLERLLAYIESESEES